MFYVFVAITIVVTVGVGFSIAIMIPGGPLHYYYFTPENAEINLKYGWTSSGKPGYHGAIEQKILDVNYPIGRAWIWYELHGVHVYTDKNVYSNLTVRFSLGFWPNRDGDRSIYEFEVGEAIHNGTESLVSFRDYQFIIYWGHTHPKSRYRLDKGYTVNLILRIELEGPDYGDLKATIPFPLYPRVYVDDLQVCSQLQDSLAILLCGVFAGALCHILGKPIKPKIVRRFVPVIDRINKFALELGLKGAKATPKAFLKKCPKCGREMPIASEECPYCKSKQP